MKVAIVMGSKSDRIIMDNAADMLNLFGNENFIELEMSKLEKRRVRAWVYI
jgi:phosphoribosylcarboxyaminoimidazole (NCAIR) mutase